MTVAELSQKYAECLGHLVAKDNSDGSFNPAYKTYQSHNITQEEWNRTLEQIVSKNSDLNSVWNFVREMYTFVVEHAMIPSDYYTKSQEDSTHGTLQNNINSEANARISGLSAKVDLLNNASGKVQVYAVGEYNSWRSGWGLSQSATDGDIAARTNDGRLLAKNGTNPVDDELLAYKYVSEHYATIAALNLLGTAKQDKIIAGAGITIGPDGKTINASTQMKIVKKNSFSELPATGAESTFYLIPLATSETNNLYEEYIWDVDASRYEKIGTIKTVLGQVQADWNQTDSDEVDFIKNKPTILPYHLAYSWDGTNTKLSDLASEAPEWKAFVLGFKATSATGTLTDEYVGMMHAMGPNVYTFCFVSLFTNVLYRGSSVSGDTELATIFGSSSAYKKEYLHVGDVSNVIGNPSDTATATLTKIKIGNTVYSIPSGGGGGTSDYTELSNKPQIGGVELSGNKSLSDLGIQSSSSLDTDVSALGYVKTAPTVIKLFDGLIGNGTYTGKSIAQLITEGYKKVRLTGYSQHADTHQRSWVLDLNSLLHTTSQICETITGWNDPLNIYSFASDGYIAWNGGTDHIIYVILIEGIK